MRIKSIHIILMYLIVGIAFPISAWLIHISILAIPYSIESIVYIHTQQPLHFLLDIIPLLAIFLAIKSRKATLDVVAQVEEWKGTTERYQKNIHSLTSFANHIGQGNYETTLPDDMERDLLSETLLNLRDRLSENHQKEAIRSWTMTGKDKISDILRLHTDLEVLSYETLVELIKYIGVIQGAFYLYDEESETLSITASYAYNRKKYLRTRFKLGEGLVGESAIEQLYIYRTEIPDDYAIITSGILGDKKPASLLIMPLVMEEKLQGAIEFASLSEIGEVEISFIQEVSEIIAQTIYNLKINAKTEKLLHESQEMTIELRENEDMLRQNAEEMRVTQEELEKTNISLEDKVREVDESHQRLYSLLENASETIAIYNADKKLTYISPSVKRIFGYSEAEMMEGKDIECLDEKSKPIYTGMLNDLIVQNSKHISIEYSIDRPDGSKIFLEAEGRNLLYDAAIKGLVVNIHDITERKRAEKEEKRRTQMQSLSENSPDIIVRVDLTGQFFYINPSIKHYTGQRPDFYYSKTIDEVGFDDDTIREMKNLLHTVKSFVSKSDVEFQMETLNGKRYFQASGIPEASEDNGIETVLIVMRDITERKKTEMMVLEQNQKITESINYSCRIQTAILPDTKFMQKIYKQSFIYYKPRDVVSGDFPWYFDKGEHRYVAAVDCTGHGVPGAMLSIIAYFLLNDIVGHQHNYTAGEVLGLLHKGVQKTLKQDQSDAFSRDGMDVALIRVDEAKKEIHFSGAHRPLFYFTEGEFVEIKGTKAPIGGIPKAGAAEVVFENHVLNYKDGDSFFIFSDGLPDQFGGPDGRKYLTKRLRTLIQDNAGLPMPQIHSVIKKDYEAWLGDGRQIDDVLLIGIRF